MMIPIFIAAVVGYLLGALPVGFLVARAKGINIFEHGSKNPGATNVRRVLGEKFGDKGKRLGNLVFMLDALKGAVATGWPLLVLKLGLWSDSGLWPYAGVAGLVSALIGHSFSCFTHFKGGKGVATGAGGLLVLVPMSLLIGMVLWLVAFYSLRYVSLASILAAVSLPITSYILGQPDLLIWVSGAIALFVIIRHRTNIVRLVKGTESKFIRKRASAAPSASDASKQS